MIIKLNLKCSCGKRRHLEVGECVMQAHVRQWEQEHRGTRHRTGSSWRPLWRQGLKFMPFKELAKNVNDRDDIIPKEKWRKSEFVWSRVISSMAWNIRIPDREGEQTPRKIMIGTSNRAAAWTDGETFIAFDRKFLAGLPLMKYDRPVIWSLIRVGQTLFHEICHDGEADDMYHSPEFYKLYHDMSKGGGGLVGLADIVAKACAYLTPAKYADLLKQAKGDEPETAEPVESEAVQAAALAKVEPKAKKGQGVAATVGGGRTAKEVVDPAEIERIWQARQGGMSFEKIEGEFGLRNANGMTAYRICKKRRATVAAV